MGSDDGRGGGPSPARPRRRGPAGRRRVGDAVDHLGQHPRPSHDARGACVGHDPGRRLRAWLTAWPDSISTQSRPAPGRRFATCRAHSGSPSQRGRRRHHSARLVGSPARLSGRTRRRGRSCALRDRKGRVTDQAGVRGVEPCRPLGPARDAHRPDLRAHNALGKGSRRPDSNRGPLHYERGLGHRPASAPGAFCLETGRFVATAAAGYRPVCACKVGRTVGHSRPRPAGLKRPPAASQAEVAVSRPVVRFPENPLG